MKVTKFYILLNEELNGVSNIDLFICVHGECNKDLKPSSATSEKSIIDRRGCCK